MKTFVMGCIVSLALVLAINLAMAALVFAHGKHLPPPVDRTVCHETGDAC